LEPEGWTFSHRTGEEDHWTRPGKAKRDGTSATTNYQGSDLLKVFSSSVPQLEPEKTYTKFGAYVALRHHGDYKAATKELASKGFGTPYISPRANNEVQRYIEEDNSRCTMDDMGNGQLLMEAPSRYFPDLKVVDVHKWVTEEKAARSWDGTCWSANENAIYWEADSVTSAMMRSDDEDVRKHGSRSRAKGKLDAMIKLFYAQPGVAVSASDFDSEPKYLNLENGVYDLSTGDFYDHHPEFMITRKFGASYDKDATCPQWESFIEAALPDDELRAYVKRCLGYTLLGDPSQRAMFIVYGPSGTGKSTFLETLNSVFGEYGDTAPAGTFRSVRDENASSATLGLHQLRGKRFVTTSETSEGVLWNEELIKRYTGHDLMRTRGLFQTFQTWKSEASIWLATNHAPRFSSDDRAIWNRVKLVPFTTVFLGEGQIFGMEDILVKEADGIFNWLLEGLADYRSHGLGEPDSVTQSVVNLREQSDSVIKFLDDKLAEGVLIFEQTQAMKRADLYNMYMAWCRTMGERALGANRFILRLKESDRSIRVSEDTRTVQGVGRIPGGWLMGA
jgi:putative DNA primase/helicase